MDRSRLMTFIGEVLDDLHGSPLPRPLPEDIELVGRHGILDSLGLVSAILDLEQRLNDEGLRDFTMDHERAMSLPASPFRTIGSLADYVMTLLQEQGLA